jgi:hypothetical protein
VRRALSLVLAAVLAIGVGVAIVSSVRDRVAAERPPSLTVVRGVIGSEKQPFFRDPEVAAAFARHGLDVQVDIAGSREIATRVDLGKYDFGFPAGIPAAEKIRRQRKVTAFYQPFYTPMAVATFKPIAQLLRKAGVASPLADGYWRFDMKRYLDLVGKETGWNQLPGNTTYTANKSMLVASTDVRTSNSGAMYLAIAPMSATATGWSRTPPRATGSSTRSPRCSCGRGSHLLVVAPAGLGDDRQPSGVGCGRRGGVVAAVS